MAEIPLIISVDDHVVEPPHLWETWLPERFKADAPRVERHGLGDLKYVGGTTYEYELTDDGTPCDIWFYEGKMYPHKRHVASVGFDRDGLPVGMMLTGRRFEDSTCLKVAHAFEQLVGGFPAPPVRQPATV